MSKLTSFSNKDKYKIYDVFFIESNYLLGHHAYVNGSIMLRVGEPKYRSFFGEHKYRRSFFVKEIIYFNKKEKILETKDKILMIESFEDKEEFFWSKVEENVKIN